MVQVSGPWDGQPYEQDEWREQFRSMGDGRIVAGVSSSLPISRSGSNRDVTVGAGKAVVQGALYKNDADVVFSLPSPAGSLQRVDFIALRLDAAQAAVADKLKLALIQGAAAAAGAAVPPALVQNTSGIWEMPLCIIGPYGTGVASAAPFALLAPTVGSRRYIPLGSYSSPGAMPGLQGNFRDEVFDDSGRSWRINDAGVWVQAYQEPIQANADGTVNMTSTSFTNLNPTCSVTFTAPSSGKVKITVHGYVATANGHTVIFSFEVRKGVGVSDPLHYGPNSRDGFISRIAPGYTSGGSSGPILVTGLTPGVTYRVWHKSITGGGTVAVAYRRLLVDPVG